MHEVEFPPFIRRQRAENRVVCQWFPLAKAFIAFGNQPIHPRDAFKNFRQELWKRSSAWKNAFWRFPSAWKPAEQSYDPTLPALCFAIRVRSRFSRSKTTLKILYRAEICQIQMVQNLCRTPFPGQMACKGIGRHSMYGVS